jgi:hypothetical protein
MLKILFTTLALSAALFSAQAQTQMQQPANIDVKSLDKSEVKSFVKAVVQVDGLRKNLFKQMNHTKEKPSQAQVNQMNKDFQAKASKIITGEGLDLKTYSKYVQLFQTNPEFQEIVKSHIPKQ